MKGIVMNRIKNRPSKTQFSSRNSPESRKLPQSQLDKAEIALTPSEPDASGCWMDLYDGPCFGGRVRRIVGPATVPPPNPPGKPAGSLIVGPQAVVFAGPQPKCKQFGPGTVLPDVTKLRGPLQLTFLKTRRATRRASSSTKI